METVNSLSGKSTKLPLAPAPCLQTALPVPFCLLCCAHAFTTRHSHPLAPFCMPIPHIRLFSELPCKSPLFSLQAYHASIPSKVVPLPVASPSDTLLRLFSLRYLSKHQYPLKTSKNAVFGFKSTRFGPVSSLYPPILPGLQPHRRGYPPMCKAVAQITRKKACLWIQNKPPPRTLTKGTGHFPLPFPRHCPPSLSVLC